MAQAKLLITDDETPVRTAVSDALDEFGTKCGPLRTAFPRWPRFGVKFRT
jgi:hypothetical protein